MRPDTYRYLLQQPKWQEKRREILDRDNHQCRHCHGNEHLEVHHRQYHLTADGKNKVPPWEYEDEYLITLCRKCHLLGHEKYHIPSFIISQ